MEGERVQGERGAMGDVCSREEREDLSLRTTTFSHRNDFHCGKCLGEQLNLGAEDLGTVYTVVDTTLGGKK